jgi:hypothetical protein
MRKWEGFEVGSRNAEVGKKRSREKKKPGNYEAGMRKAEPFDCGLPWRDINQPIN